MINRKLAALLEDALDDGEIPLRKEEALDVLREVAEIHKETLEMSPEGKQYYQQLLAAIRVLETI